jgi:hypothetical protein
MNNIESMLTPTKAARMIRINLSGMFRELKKVVAILVTFSLIIYDIANLKEIYSTKLYILFSIL